MNWSEDELYRINQADDLHIAPLRPDGKTHGTPTWIWEVVVAGQLYVRAYSGNSSRWYQAASAQKKGVVIAAGMTRDVRFEPVSDESLNASIDEAYRAKYPHSPYVGTMVGERARKATIRIMPA